MTEIMIQTINGKKQIALVENGKLIEYYEEDKEYSRREGNIYIGIVKDVIDGMQSAFVDIGTEKNGFIHVKDILPQIDETKEKIEEEMAIRKVVKPNQKLLVQVKKDSNDKKEGRRYMKKILLGITSLTLRRCRKSISRSSQLFSKRL